MLDRRKGFYEKWNIPEKALPNAHLYQSMEQKEFLLLVTGRFNKIKTNLKQLSAV